MPFSIGAVFISAFALLAAGNSDLNIRDRFADIPHI